MGIEVEATCTPQVEQKVVAASITSASYAQASEQLKTLAEVEIGEKRVERIAQRVGRQRVKQREQQLEAYQALPLPKRKKAPADASPMSWDNRVAVVMVDGGRAQLRDERWATPREPGEKRRSWWRESKVALLATFAGTRQQADPLPQIPACLLDPLWLIPLVNEIKAAHRGETAAEELRSDLAPEVEAEVAAAKARWSPQPLVRSVVATFQPYAHLGQLAQVEAYHRGFAVASRKAFVADGLPTNWTLQEQYFSDYTPIVDLMHALSYVYQAAQASAGDMEQCWQLCQHWLPLIWQGKVSQVVEAIDVQIAQIEAEAETRRERESVLETLHESRRYLSNNQNRMKYDKYRQEGLPITTALMESTIKQSSRRMKGTEKFWNDGAEPQLQLCVDSLSETHPLDSFWSDRRQSQTGFRKSRANQ